MYHCIHVYYRMHVHVFVCMCGCAHHVCDGGGVVVMFSVVVIFVVPVLCYCWSCHVGMCNVYR